MYINRRSWGCNAAARERTEHLNISVRLKPRFRRRARYLRQESRSSRSRRSDQVICARREASRAEGDAVGRD